MHEKFSRWRLVDAGLSKENQNQSINQGNAKKDMPITLGAAGFPQRFIIVFQALLSTAISIYFRMEVLSVA